MAIVYKTVGCLLLLTILGLYQEAQAGARATWFIQGDSVTTNKTFSLNTGDTFAAQCRGAGSAATDANLRAQMYVTKSVAPSNTNPVVAATTAGVPIKVTFTSGTLVYNYFEGPAKGFDHWQFNLYVNEKTITGVRGSGVLQLVIPRVSAVDVGTYYCGFYDGSAAASATTFAASTGITLQIATRSSGRNLATSKMLDYSFALLTAYKIMY